MARSAADEVRRIVASTLSDGFNSNNIPGLTTTPTITQNPTRRIDEDLWIEVISAGENEVDGDFVAQPYEYLVYVSVITKAGSYGGGQRQSDAVIREFKRLLRFKTGFPDLTGVGYSIYKMTTDPVVSDIYRLGGSNFYKSVMPLLVSAEFVGVSAAEDPIQLPIFTYTGWGVEPTGTRIVTGDAGDINTQLTGYASPNRGWTFLPPATVELPIGGDGTLVNGVLTVGAADGNIDLAVDLNYEFASNSALTTTLNTTHAWARVNPLRFGAIATTGTPVFVDDATANIGLDNITDFVGTNRTIDIARLTEAEIDEHTIELTYTVGDHAYIMYPSGLPDLTALRQTRFNNVDILNRFNSPVTVGAYKIYVTNAVLNFNQTVNLRLEF